MKMLHSSLLLTMVVIVTCTFSACKKGDTGATGPIGPTGPASQGIISGHVFLYDQYGSIIETNLAGAKVFVEGLNDTATTDSSGAYALGALPTGSYTIDCMDTTFGLVKAIDVQFFGGNALRDFRLSKTPSFNITATTIIDTAGLISITSTVPFDARTRTALIFVGNSSAVSSNPANYQVAYSTSIKAGVTSFNYKIQPNDLYNIGLNSGSTAYIAIYSVGNSNVSSYEDVATGRTNYTSLGITPVIGSVLVP